MACILTGCGPSYHWTKSHPLYKQVPYSSLSITGTENAFILTRSKWFAKKLGFDSLNVQKEATKFCEQVFLDELRRAYPNYVKIPDQNFNHFPEESQRLDERIFMKGRLPEQGVVVKDSAGDIPPYILILHEFIVGTDLKRETYFDYALIHNEMTDKKTSTHISAIISYTLWDNERQRPLFSAVDEVQRPITKPTPEDLEALVRSAVKQIRINLYGGVS